MIRLEYDKNFGGPRVSFNLNEGSKGLPNVPALFEASTDHGEGTFTCPQTPANLAALEYLIYFGGPNV
jgi:hypothetical protein